MAQLTRYFGTASAGTGDGTSYANRAALFDGSNNWSTVITGTNFTTDSLLCYIDSGSYTCGQSLAAAGFTNPPTALRTLSLIAAPGGTVWAPPNPAWISAQPMWSDVNMPSITYTPTTTAMIASLHSHLYGLKITGSTTSAVGVISFASGTGTVNWCFVENNASNSNAYAVFRFGNNFRMANCVIVCSGTIFNAVLGQSGDVGFISNSRFQGNPAASSGNRRGIVQGGSNSLPTIDRCCVFGCLNPVISTSTTNSQHAHIRSSTLIGTGSGDVVSYTGIQATPTAIGSHVSNSIIGNGVDGIDTNDFAQVSKDCLFLETSGSDTVSDYDIVAINNQAPADTLAQVFVDPSNATVANRDFRIRSGSPYWGKGYGVGDEAAGSAGFNGGFQN